MLTPAQELALDVLQTRTSFAVIGVSAQPEKYGYEVCEALSSASYTVYPINPKYDHIDGHPCYPSLAALPALPDAVIVALAPQVSEQTVPKAVEAGAPLIWLPPGCFTPAAMQACQAAGVPVVHDVCPVGALRALRMIQENQGQ